MTLDLVASLHPLQDVHHLQDGLVHQTRQRPLDPRHHVTTHANLAPRVQGHGGVVGGHVLGGLGLGPDAQHVDGRVGLLSEPKEKRAIKTNQSTILITYKATKCTCLKMTETLPLNGTPGPD